MSSSSRDYGRFDELAEEFAERYRRGERPGLQEYVDRLPEMADEIREKFPALVEVERIEGDARDDARRSPPAASPHLGELGDYRIVREVGRGGMGVVYEAEQISLGRHVALKVLPGYVAGNRKALERFRREAKAAARLHHTNIVPVFEVGRGGDVAFYAMQFIQGQGLDEVVDELGRLRRRDGESVGGGRAASGRPAKPAIGTETARATAAGPRSRELRRVAESLLIGQLGTERLGTAAGAAFGATVAAGTEAIDPAGTTDAGAIGTGQLIPEPPPAAGMSRSAVLPGGTAISSVESSGRRQMYFRSVAQIGRQVAQGLAYAHSRGVVHRDIKPSNLILDTQGVVWITDFGLAKAEDDGLTATGDILGTLRYMAPERFRGEGDARADIYALGLTLYELLTLRPGFESSDRLELIERIKTQEPPRPRTVDSRIPRDLETIVLEAINKDLDRRYAMAEDLRRFLADEPIQARPISVTERYWRWARRNPVIAALGGVLIAVLVLAAFGSLLAAGRFARLAEERRIAALQERSARQDADRARIEARRREEEAKQTRNAVARLALAQEGHADRGLHLMLEALKTAPEDAKELRRMLRWNLGAWLGQVHGTLRIIETGGPCNYLAFSPDGWSFATSFNPRDRSIATPINFWDTASGRKLSSLPGAFAPFAFRPDGKVLIAHDDQRRVVAVDLTTRRVLWMTPQTLGEFGARIDFSPDASTVLVTYLESSQRSGLFRLDALTGQQRGEPIRSRWWMAAALDGRTVASRRVEDGKAYIDVLDLPSGRRTASWPAAENELLEFTFSPDAKSLFARGFTGGLLYNQKNQFGQVWDAGSGRPTSPLMMSTEHGNYPPSADYLVTKTQYQWLVRDARSSRVRGAGSPAGAEEFLASHPDGRAMLAASGDGVVRLWQISPEAEPISGGGTDAQASMTGVEPDRPIRHVIVFSAGRVTDGRIAISRATGAGGRELFRLSDLATGRPIGRPASHYPGWQVRSLALSPDSRSFATGSNPDGRTAGEVRLWDASTGRLRFPPMLHTNYVAALAFQPDGKALAAGDFSGQVRLWDTSTGREIGRPLSSGEIVLSLAYSPDGRVLAAGLANDHTGKPGVRLWDTRTRQPIGGLLPSTQASPGSSSGRMVEPCSRMPVTSGLAPPPSSGM
jgi:serine/threonine protein kinase/WD40 repeat protein